MTDVLPAPAKLTVSLRVTGVRADGSHPPPAAMVTLAPAAEPSGWLVTIMPSGSHRRLTSARRLQVSAGRIASASHRLSAKLK